MARKTKNTKSKSLSTAPAKLPVTLLSGFLGAGKTTLLKHIFESNNHKKKIAIIVNDMASLNIDASLVEKSGLIHTKQEMVTMQNGCICCTLRVDLIREINRLQSIGGFDYLVIESTGISEPMQVAESFCADPHTMDLAEDESEMLWNTARLDTLVTVVDCMSFPFIMNSLESFKQHFANSEGVVATADEEGEKNIAQLLVEQVEFANVIVLNKMDLVTDQQMSETLALLKTLNPTAKVVRASFGVVSVEAVLNTGLFSMEEAKSAAGWLQSLRKEHDTKGNNEKGKSLGTFQVAASSEAVEYGVTSFVYRNRAPFHPARLYALLSEYFFLHDHTKPKSISSHFGAGMEDSKLTKMHKKFGLILRSKGFCWLAGRDAVMGEWAQAGRILNITALMPWYGTLPEEEWGIGFTESEEVAIRQDILPPHGDRRQEVVFIGTNLNTPAIIASLDECLLSETELENHNVYKRGCYFDPLPCWIQEIEEPDQFWCTVLRVGQSNQLSVQPGIQLELQSAALETIVEDITTPSLSLQLWLDCDAQSVLRVSNTGEFSVLVFFERVIMTASSEKPSFLFTAKVSA